MAEKEEHSVVWEHFSADCEGKIYASCRRFVWRLDSAKLKKKRRKSDNHLVGVAFLSGKKLETAKFDHVGGLEAMDDTKLGRIWVSEYRKHIVKELSAEGLAILAGQKGMAGHVDGAAKSAEFDSPRSLVRSARSNSLFVLDNNGIRIIDLRTLEVSTLALKSEKGEPIEHDISSSLTNPTLVSASHQASNPSSMLLLSLETASFCINSEDGVCSPTSFGAGSVSGIFRETNFVVRRNATWLAAPTLGSCKLSHIYPALPGQFYLPQLNCLLQGPTMSKSNEFHAYQNFLSSGIPRRRNSHRHFISLLLAPHMPYDRIVQQKSSEAGWRVHYDVIACHPSNFKLEKTIRNLARTVRDSLLPKASISALFRYLYFQELDKDHLYRTCSEIVHIIHLCRQIGLKTDWLEYEFGSILLPLLTPKSLCSLLVSLWNDRNIVWSTDDVIVEYMAAEIRERAKLLFVGYAPGSTMVADVDRCAELMNLVTGTSELRSAASNFDSPNLVPTLISLPLMEVSFSHLSAKSKKKSKHEEELDDVGQYLESPFEFAVAAKNSNTWIIVRLWLLYSQWSYFRTIYDVDAEVRQKKRWIAPDWMTHKILVCILAATHNDAPYQELLSAPECELLIERGPSVGVAKGKVPWKGLFQFCTDRLKNWPSSSDDVSSE